MTLSRLELRIPSGAAPSWDDIMEGRPASLHLERRADELVLSRVDAPATGLRLRADGATHVLAIPAFASFDEISIAGSLAAQIATLGGGVIEVAGREVPAALFPELFEDDLAVAFARTCLERFLALLDGPPADVIEVEGVRRPLYLGPRTAGRLVAVAQEGDVYERIVAAVEALQQLAAPTVFARPFPVRTPDGVTAIYAMWEPRAETLLPPCDYLLIRESATSKIRVPQARIAEAVRLPGDDALRGVPLDERHWLLGAHDEATVARLLAHASSVGVRLTLNDPRS